MTYTIPYRGNLDWLQQRTIFYTRHGSHAYGTNIETSDEDFKGVAIPPAEYFHGFVHRFEQAESKEPDMVIFDIRKFFELAADCNPNIIEVLWTDPADHLICTDLGREIVNAKHLFLSKKAKFTFSGYAVAQMKRINVHYRWLVNPPAAPPKRSDFGLSEKPVIPKDQMNAAVAAVKKVMDAWEWRDLDTLDESTRIEVKNAFFDRLATITAWSWEELSDKTWLAAARSIGLESNFIEILAWERCFNGAQKEWDNYNHWLQTRNPQRAELEAKFGYDTKHGMHLVRLLTMCEEILLTGEVFVKRKDRERLLSIRRGDWTYSYLVGWAVEMDKKLDELYKTSTALPKNPNRNKLSDLCAYVVERSFLI